MILLPKALTAYSPLYSNLVIILSVQHLTTIITILKKKRKVQMKMIFRLFFIQYNFWVETLRSKILRSTALTRTFMSTQSLDKKVDKNSLGHLGRQKFEDRFFFDIEVQ